MRDTVDIGLITDVNCNFLIISEPKFIAAYNYSGKQKNKKIKIYVTMKHSYAFFRCIELNKIDTINFRTKEHG